MIKYNFKKILAPRFGSTDVETMNKKVVTTLLSKEIFSDMI